MLHYKLNKPLIKRLQYLLLCIALVCLSGCSPPKFYEQKFVTAFLQVCNESSRDKYLPYILANTSSELVDEVKNYLYNTNYASSCFINFDDWSMEISDTTAKCLGIVHFVLPSSDYYAVTYFCFRDNKLISYSIDVKTPFVGDLG